MRKEYDSFGEINVEDDALYGASTQRAVDNFSVSQHRMPQSFIHALAHVKWACAEANTQLGQLDKEKASLIGQACREIIEGAHDDHFPLNVFQTGSGTSSNMNINEVIMNRANEMRGKPKGIRTVMHPNDDVNKGQSSNDVMPTALHIQVALGLRDQLIPALERLHDSLASKSDEFSGVIKIGRTHLMDAVPMTMGQEFSGYAEQVRKSIQRARKALAAVMQLAIGGTAVGTGMNTHDEFSEKVCACLAARLDLPFRPAANHFEMQAARDDCVEAAGLLMAVNGSLIKIANDIRLLGSGPRCGLGEIKIPATQPGSSIMPGKVNPVMSEMLIQLCFYANAMCQCVQRCGQDGYFELNATIPLIAYCMDENISCIGRGVSRFTELCVDGIKADQKRCEYFVERSIMLVTALVPELGYDKAAAIARRAHEEDKTLREVLMEEGMGDLEVNQLLDVTRMIL